MSLKNTQQQFSDDILDGNLNTLRGQISSPLMATNVVFKTYVNNVHLSLFENLKKIYPITFSQIPESNQKVLFKQFFVDAQDTNRCLSDYGLDFPSHIEDQTLHDISLFDRAIYLASHQDFRPSLKLADTTPDDFMSTIFKFNDWVFLHQFHETSLTILEAETPYCILSKSQNNITVDWVTQNTFDVIRYLKSGQSLDSIQTPFDSNEVVAILFNRNIIYK